MPKIRPLNNIVLVEEVKEEKKKGEIYLPEKETGRFVKLRVLAVGNLVENLKVDDLVYANPLAEKIEGNISFVNSKDILGVIEND